MKTVYDFTVKDRKGNDVCLSEYKGKVLLIVNTATGCGFTPHYDPLEAMYKDLRDKGFEILDFPSNQFAGQAQGSDDEILLGDILLLVFGGPRQSVHGVVRDPSFFVPTDERYLPRPRFDCEYPF